MADFDPTNQAALKAELLNDPKALGLVGKTDAQAAALLNAIGASADTIAVTAPIASYLIINATDATEYAALSTAEKTRYQTITGAGLVDSNNANVRAAFQAMFAAGATRTALLALANRSCSRAEKLFGSGVVLQAWDVARARAS